MEIDKQTLLNDVASELWKLSDPFGENAPYEEQDPMVQFNIKNSVLPVVNITLRKVEETMEQNVKDNIMSYISNAQDDGHTSDEILLALALKLM